MKAPRQGAQTEKKTLNPLIKPAARPVIVNGAVYRRLALASTDAASIQMTEPTQQV